MDLEAPLATTRCRCLRTSFDFLAVEKRLWSKRRVQWWTKDCSSRLLQTSARIPVVLVKQPFAVPKRPPHHLVAVRRVCEEPAPGPLRTEPRVANETKMLNMRSSWKELVARPESPGSPTLGWWTRPSGQNGSGSPVGDGSMNLDHLQAAECRSCHQRTHRYAANHPDLRECCRHPAAYSQNLW